MSGTDLRAAVYSSGHLPGLKHSDCIGSGVHL